MSKISPFFALCAQLEQVTRWSKSISIKQENVATHSLQTAMYAHALCLIENMLAGKDVYNPSEAAVYAMYHDVAECITEDPNTLYKSLTPRMKALHSQLEDESLNIILNSIPDNLKEAYRPILFQKRPDNKHEGIVKAADLLSAYTKSITEVRCGNADYIRSTESILKKIKEKSKDFKSVSYFLDWFIPAFKDSTDELTVLLKKD